MVSVVSLSEEMISTSRESRFNSQKSRTTQQFSQAEFNDLGCDLTIFKKAAEKIKAGVFGGPQIRDLVHDYESGRKNNKKEKSAWLSFKTIIQNFLGNRKADNCEIMATRMLLTFRKLRCNMSVKFYFLFDRFPKNLRATSDGQRAFSSRFQNDGRVLPRSLEQVSKEIGS
ncbi:hypothetical protein AVEN_38086-1 [Araneus ventricosus]|uniref:Uncharacterized protein n=1 Tax=Araneus ventricosus TaxID=182803 RepID=A0A4Y2VQU7_ARAVE|nr:hypothetical protein AVEN_38086-1 [Araneus ventricosus]